jgi:U6 snRNA-associated Sm-like protein LSm1
MSLETTEAEIPEEEDPVQPEGEEEPVQVDAATALAKSVEDEYLPGDASLIEKLDKRILIVLRDGRHLVGKLRSFDQFMNLILEETCERVLLTGKDTKKKYCDFPLGLYIVRGDNIVLLGEIDVEVESENLERIDQEQYLALSADQDEGGKVVWDFE